MARPDKTEVLDEFQTGGTHTDEVYLDIATVEGGHTRFIWSRDNAEALRRSLILAIDTAHGNGWQTVAPKAGRPSEKPIEHYFRLHKTSNALEIYSLCGLPSLPFAKQGRLSGKNGQGTKQCSNCKIVFETTMRRDPWQPSRTSRHSGSSSTPREVTPRVAAPSTPVSSA